MKLSKVWFLVAFLFLVGCTPPEEKARALYNQALADIRDGKTEEGEKLLRQVVADYPQTESATKANEELDRKVIVDRLQGKISDGDRNDAEAAAVANLRTVNTAEVTFLSSSGGNYGTISQLVGEGLLDASFMAGKFGYTFNVETDGVEFTATAEPVQHTSTAKYFYSGADAVVRYETGKPAGPNSRETQ